MNFQKKLFYGYRWELAVIQALQVLLINHIKTRHKQDTFTTNIMTAKADIKKYLQLVIRYNTLFIFLIMLVISAIVSDVFFTSANLFNLTRQVTPVGIASMGMLLVILTGGIDLSVGSIVAMAGVLCALF